MRGAILALISVYQKVVSPWLGTHCRFYPNCSEAARLAIEGKGLIRGGWLALGRLLLCHPFYSGKFDPIEKLNG